MTKTNNPQNANTWQNTCRVQPLQFPEPRFIPSLRLQIAAMAMQGMVANGEINPDHVATKALAFADALLTKLPEPRTEENESKRKKTKLLSLSNNQPTETDPTVAEKFMLRAWCEYRNMEYVEGYVNPSPSENFAKGYQLGRRDALAMSEPHNPKSK
ncbi:MAG: hypothetical protein HDS68_02570 [Bacteroidales bacterium]|nr:hypothetical protein [Bacteroidales bacterium]